ncbi:MAG: hypothetical protein M3376_00230 [Actinomycetota bacterium]|nr:hypothetical protein [Actinomycetota bacterium]
MILRRRIVTRCVEQCQKPQTTAGSDSGIAAASFGYAILRLSRFTILDARPPGDNSRAQQVSALEHAAAVADNHRSLPKLSDWVRSVADELRSRWPDTDIDYDTRKYLPRW